jgi:hypothetical protein
MSDDADKIAEHKFRYVFEADGKIDIPEDFKSVYELLKGRVADVLIEFCDKREAGENDAMFLRRLLAANAVWSLVLGDTFAHATGWLMRFPTQTIDEIRTRMIAIAESSEKVRGGKPLDETARYPDQPNKPKPTIN